eukprot:SAG22_NODE_614_length_8559_cov_4.732033_6_plen_133_part_00
MAPPFGFKMLLEKVTMIEDQCSDESDKKDRNKKKLEDAENRSQDPFVRKKMMVQEKIAETREVRFFRWQLIEFAAAAARVRPHHLFGRRGRGGGGGGGGGWGGGGGGGATSPSHRCEPPPGSSRLPSAVAAA